MTLVTIMRPILWRTPFYGALAIPYGAHAILMAHSGKGVSAVAGPSQEIFSDQVVEHDPACDFAQSEQTSSFAQGEPFAERFLERPQDD